MSRQRQRTQTRPAPPPDCRTAPSDPRDLLRALKPLGGGEDFAEHAASCPECFDRAAQLLLLTAEETCDPHRGLLDGLAHCLYEMAKAAVRAAPRPVSFRFDDPPPPLDESVGQTEAALEALAEYTDGASERCGEARSMRRLLADVRRGASLESIVREALGRALALGGPHGLDAANLLGFLALERGDLEEAERMFRTVIERPAASRYERETQAHAMNNLAGVLARRQRTADAILWAERSLLSKERLGLDTRTNWVNLLVFWLEHGTAYGVERSRAALRALLALDGGREWLAELLAREEYRGTVDRLRLRGLDREFPEVRLPPVGEAGTGGIEGASAESA